MHGQQVQEVEGAENEQEDQQARPRRGAIIERNQRRHEEGRHTGAHQRTDRDFEMRIVGPAADGDCLAIQSGFAGRHAPRKNGCFVFCGRWQGRACVF